MKVSDRLSRALSLGVVALFSDGCAASRASPRLQPATGPLAFAADTTLSRRIDSVVLTSLKSRNIPGASVAVLKRDIRVHIAGYGLADLDKRTAVTPSTIFQIASLTKPFTAMAVLMLVEEGKVGLDTPAARYVPQLPHIYSSITIRQLLTHTSGITPDLRRANVDEMELAEFWRRLAERPVSFVPGERIQYANVGYSILSFVVEEASGLPFGEFLRRRIFAPLGMKHSGYRVREIADSIHAMGYDLVDGQNVKAPHVFSGWGNSGIETTVEDLARWAAAIERCELLSPVTYGIMFAPGRLANAEPAEFSFSGVPAHYGFGWFLTTQNGRTLQTHGGAIAGFSSILSRFPDSGYTVIVLSNGKQGADRLGQADAISRAISALLGL